MSWRETAVGEFILRIPPMIRTIILVSTALWLAALFTNPFLSEFWFGWAFSPEAVLRGRVWTLLTYQPLENWGEISGILFNSLMIGIFGRDLERRWGSWHFLGLYVAGGFGGAAACWLLSLVLGSGFALGAFAASNAVMIAYALVWPTRQVAFFAVIPMQARTLVIVLVLLNLAFAWSAQGPASLWPLGGLVGGYLYVRFATGVRLPGFNPGGWFSGLRSRWRRRHLASVDKDWEKLMREDDDGRSH